MDEIRLRECVRMVGEAHKIELKLPQLPVGDASDLVAVEMVTSCVAIKFCFLVDFRNWDKAEEAEFRHTIEDALLAARKATLSSVKNWCQKQ